MIKQSINRKLRTKCGVSILALLFIPSLAAQLPLSSVESILSFEMAIKSAQKNDPWLMGNFHKQRSIESMSTAVSTLPDPKISIGLANLPTNGFDFGQELK